MVDTSDEQKKVNWWGFVKMAGVTSIDQIETIAKTFEDLVVWFGNVDAELRFLLLIGDKEVVGPESQSEAE